MTERIVSSMSSLVTVGNYTFPLYLILMAGCGAALAAAGIYMLIFLLAVRRFDPAAEARPVRAAFPVLALTWGFIIIVLTCSRDASYAEPFGRFLESYYQAWSSVSVPQWENIVLNILLFVPLGFFISGCHRKLSMALPVVFVCALYSFAIEVYQYYSMTGIAEIDDIVDNTLGSLIGCGLYYIARSVVRFRRGPLFRRILFGLTPVFICIGAGTVILAAYRMKPYGNFATSVLYPQKTYTMYISWEVPETQMEDPEKTVSGIFQTHEGTEAEAFELAGQIFEAFGETADDWSLESSDGVTTVATDDGRFTMKIQLNGMRYTFYPTANGGDFSGISSSAATMKEARVRQELERYGFTLPDDAAFRDNSDGSYTFTIYSSDDAGNLSSGKFTVYFAGDVRTSVQFLGIDNQVVQGNEIGEEEILTPSQIRLLVRSGYFQISEWNQRTNPIENIKIDKLSVTHGTDSKGYVRDVYVLRAKINNSKEYYYITIPAAADENNRAAVQLAE
jgi:VanZ family protein